MELLYVIAFSIEFLFTISGMNCNIEHTADILLDGANANNIKKTHTLIPLLYTTAVVIITIAIITNISIGININNLYLFILISAGTIIMRTIFTMSLILTLKKFVIIRRFVITIISLTNVITLIIAIKVIFS